MVKIWDLLDLFRKGNAVADPKLWKQGSAAVMAVTALLLAITKIAGGLGYELPLSEADASAVATGIITVVGLFSTYATSNKVGLPGLTEHTLPSEHVTTFPTIAPDASGANNNTVSRFPKEFSGGG